MRLRFPIPVAVLAGAVGIGAISMAGAQGPTLQPAANPVAYSLVLNGANEVTPNVGDPDGAGQASITVDGTTGQVCVNITTTDIDNMTLMHIHTGASTVNGPVFVDFAPPLATAVVKCVTTTPANAQTIIANPTGHYLNVHNAAFPAGAIRAQLAAPGTVGDLRVLDTPARAYDSRAITDGRLVVSTPRVVDLTAGTNSAVPATARAALVTVTVTQTVGGGFLTAYSSALSAAPATSTVNWTAPNSDVATTTTVAVSGGKINVLAGQNPTHVIVDVIGYYL